MDTIRINLKDCYTLRFEPRTDNPDEFSWRVYNHESEVRHLNPFEAEFVEASLAAGREGSELQRRGHVVYSGTNEPHQFEAPPGQKVEWSAGDESRLDAALGQTYQLDVKGFQGQAGQLGKASLPMAPVFVTGMLADPVLPSSLTTKVAGDQHIPHFLLKDELKAKQGSFQSRVRPWTVEVFGDAKAYDKMTRNFRFAEEATELVQACGLTKEEMLSVVDYVYGRPVGVPHQEVGGVMTTLASLCNAHEGIDMHVEGERELLRCQQPEVIAKIRAKQAQKPKRVDPDVEAT